MARSPRDAACAHVSRKFPQMKGARPSVARAGDNRIYTFTKSVAVAPGGPKVQQVVRVTVSKDGTILKVVGSK